MNISLSKHSIALSATIFLLSGCKSIEVMSFYSQGADFSDYYTFTVEDPLAKNNDYSVKGAESQQLIINAIASEMEQRGYEYVEQRHDLIVSYVIVLDNKIDYDVNRYNSFYGRRSIYYDSFGNPYFYRYNTVSAREYKEGTLIIEIKQRKKKKLVWQGSVDLRINKRSKKSKDQIVEETINLIFTEYPFEAGKDEPVLISENKE